jgi:hypothetical protein
MFMQHFMTLVSKFLYKLMDLDWLAKVILIEDIPLYFNSHNCEDWNTTGCFSVNEANLVHNFS